MFVVKKTDVAGRERVIMVETGRKSQSVNVCTLAGVQGQYDSKIYLKPAFFVNEEWFCKYDKFEATIRGVWRRGYDQLM